MFFSIRSVVTFSILRVFFRKPPETDKTMLQISYEYPFFLEQADYQKYLIEISKQSNARFFQNQDNIAAGGEDFDAEQAGMEYEAIVARRAEIVENARIENDHREKLRLCL